MSHRVNAPLQFRKMSVRNELSDLEIEDFFGSFRELLQSWTKIIVHLKYEDIDSLFRQVLKILTTSSPHSMLHMIWANAKSLSQHCVGGGGSKHHALITAKAYMCVALNTS